MDQISISVTGKVVRNPFTGTTRNGKPMTTFTLAAYLPPRTPGSDGTTRWFKVFCFDTLDVAASMAFETLTTAKAPRRASRRGPGRSRRGPWRGLGWSAPRAAIRAGMLGEELR